MILLTVIAVGLLTLSSVSIRTAARNDSMSLARANAKLALMIAIGDLQKTAGPDKAITAPANLVDANAAPGVTGVWKSWKAGHTSPNYDAKSASNFQGYLISGSDVTGVDLESQPNPGEVPDTKTASKDTRKLVGSSSVGTNNSSAEINAPVLTVSGKSKATTGGLAWVTMDEGVKGRIDLMPATDPASTGDSIAQIGAPARNGFEGIAKLDFLNKKNEDLKELNTILPKLVSLKQAGFPANDKEATARYFNDFTVASNSLQVDVANGGLKTDLSVLFDNPSATATTLPDAYANRYLYSDDAVPFQGASMNADIRWDFYANYARLYRRVTANDLKAGMKAALPAGYGTLKKTVDSKLKGPRYEATAANLKQPILLPTVLRVDTIFSIVAHDSHGNRTPAGSPYNKMLFLTYLPVVTLHNPYNVPLRVNSLQVEFSDIPVGFEFLVNGLPTTNAGLDTINNFYVDAGDRGASKVFNMQLSNSLSGPVDVPIGAGETRIFGTPFPATATWASEVGSNGSGSSLMFDWQSNQTGQTAVANTMPGLCSPGNIGIGFHVDWLARDGVRSQWVTDRRNDGVVMLKDDDVIKVNYGPKIPSTAAASNSFGVTVRLGSQEAAKTQVFYRDEARLKAIMSEGVSDRFPEVRTFPASCPRPSESPITTRNIYEPNTTQVKAYSKARPFAVFSVSAKTTMESFTMSRPMTDTGMSFQMATCDFVSNASGGASPLEFALVPVKQNGFAIESGGLAGANNTSLQAFFFGGHGANKGSNNATFYEIPIAPLQSIAQLRNANGGSISSAPYVTYTVGESRAHPAIPSDVAFSKPDTTRVMLDRSWLANDTLWDKYWFSSLSTLQGVGYNGAAARTQKDLATEFYNGTRRLPNARNVAYKAGKSADEAAAAAITTGGAQAAAYMMTQGGFNVNSTSVPAWMSVLSSLCGADVPLTTGSPEKDPKGTPFLRIRQPVMAGGSNATAKDKLWNSYRTLESGEIETLAKEIVKEVRDRGPFLSMSEFVNRRLSTGPLSTSGAIQAALDRANLNTAMLGNARAISPANVSGYGWANPDAVINNTGAGGLGEISQGDVLSTIGSFVTVRSDTFTVRAAGDARDGNGNITARAWCEAVVQRLPEYVDTTETAESVPILPVNINFGRRFAIVSFRWLNESEI
ncbi:hypothetical protein GCM10023212_05480 [Luteolibacter yonseiensis]